MPPSPRANRQLSMTGMQIQELMNNPPTAGTPDPKFAGRDWQHIAVGELVNPKDVRFVELDTGIEDATNVRPSYLLLTGIRKLTTGKDSNRVRRPSGPPNPNRQDREFSRCNIRL